MVGFVEAVRAEFEARKLVPPYGHLVHKQLGWTERFD